MTQLDRRQTGVATLCIVALGAITCGGHSGAGTARTSDGGEATTSLPSSRTSSTLASSSAVSTAATASTAGSESATESGSGSTSSTTRSTATTRESTSTAPTWTYLFNTYLAAGATIGHCDGGSCHSHTECDSPVDCYQWIGMGQQGSLVPTDGGNPLFSWDNGSMPGGKMPGSEPQADHDFAAWIAAGSMDN